MIRLLIVFLIFCSSAKAAQMIPVADKIEVTAVISAHTLNRIKLEGGYIDDVIYSKEDITLRKVDGEIFVDSLGTGKKTLWIISKSGIKFRLILKASETVVLGQQIFLIEQSGENFRIHDNYRDQLITFYKSIYSDNIPEGYKAVYKKKKFKKDKLKLTRIISYEPSAPGLYGQVFEIRNKSDQALTLDPADFYKKGIKAIKIDSHLLAEDEVTRMYVISVKGASW